MAQGRAHVTGALLIGMNSLLNVIRCKYMLEIKERTVRGGTCQWLLAVNYNVIYVFKNLP